MEGLRLGGRHATLAAPPLKWIAAAGTGKEPPTAGGGREGSVPPANSHASQVKPVYKQMFADGRTHPALLFHLKKKDTR